MKVVDDILHLSGRQFGVRTILKDPVNHQWLVFLHDALGSIAQWKDFPVSLLDRYDANALIIEREGHGRSSRIPQTRDYHYLHREAWEKLPKILQTLKIQHPVIIGHSDGATIALLYAAKFSVKAVISIAGHVINETKTIEAIRQANRTRDLLIEKLKKYHGDGTQVLFEAWHDVWTSKPFRNYDIQSAIRALNAPLLIIQSQDDEYASVDQINKIKQAVSSQRISIYQPEQAGHAPHLTQQEMVANVIAEFLNKLNLSG